ncbi:MAG: CDGSH iron-sulfur domain-containing protein [Bacteroidales bacterium]
MEKPKRAGDQPKEVTLEQGKTYAWCACGFSKNQPFCDGSHKTTAFQPHIIKAEKSGSHYMCICKETKTKPFCDGSHNKK